MRSPEKAPQEFEKYESIRVYTLDVTKDETIHSAVKAAIDDFWKIDVLLNNAGYGIIGAFETTSIEQIEKEFDTNVVGMMRVTKAMLPHLRANRGGHIINLASFGGRATVPLFSVYHWTKWAIEWWTESLSYELEQFGIHVKMIEPGAIDTPFYDDPKNLLSNPEIDDYKEYVARVMPKIVGWGRGGVEPSEVAKVIYKASQSTSGRLRYPVPFATSLNLFLRRLLGDRLFVAIVKRIVGN